MARGAILTVMLVLVGLVSTGIHAVAAPSPRAMPIGTTVRVPGGSYRAVSP